MLAIQPPLGHVKAPYWNKETASLYFVSDKPSTVHRYHPETNHFFSAPLGLTGSCDIITSCFVTFSFNRYRYQRNTFVRRLHPYAEDICGWLWHNGPYIFVGRIVARIDQHRLWLLNFRLGNDRRKGPRRRLSLGR